MRVRLIITLRSNEVVVCLSRSSDIETSYCMKCWIRALACLTYVHSHSVPGINAPSKCLSSSLSHLYLSCVWEDLMIELSMFSEIVIQLNCSDYVRGSVPCIMARLMILCGVLFNQTRELRMYFTLHREL
jgi:hypothetical protein